MKAKSAVSSDDMRAEYVGPGEGSSPESRRLEYEEPTDGQGLAHPYSVARSIRATRVRPLATRASKR